MATDSYLFVMKFLSPALVFSALFFPTLLANAGCLKGDCPDDVILVSMSPGCSERELLEKTALSAASAEALAPVFRPLYGHPGRPDLPGDINAASAELEKAKRQYYRLEYDEAESAVAGLLERLNHSSFPLDLLEERWKVTEAAMALSALVCLGKGDAAGYDHAVLELALTRPGAAFDGNYPPQFRKAFESAKIRAASMPGKKIIVKSTMGKWKIFVDGLARGITPLEFVAAPGKRVVEYLAPNGTTKAATAVSPAENSKFVIDPFITEVSYNNGTATVCLPEGQKVASSDVGAAAAYFKTAQGMALVPVPGGVSMMLVSAADHQTPRILILASPDAASDKKVKQSVAEMIGPAARHDFLPTSHAEVAKDEKAWYKQWWFWTAAAGVAAAAIGLPLYFCLDSGGKSGTLGTITLSP